MSRFPTKEEDSQASVAAVWRRYWRQMRSRKGSLFLILFSYGTASVLASAVVPWVYRFLIDSLSVNAPGAIAEIAQIFWLLAAIILLYNILFRLGDYFIVLFQTEIMRQLEKTVFAGTIKHSLDFFADNFVGSLVAKASRFVRAFENLSDIFIYKFWMGGVQTLFILGGLFWLDGRLGLLFLFWLAVYIAVIAWFIKRAIALDSRAASENSRLTGVFSDILTNIANLKTFAAAGREKKFFARLVGENIAALRRAWFFANWQWVAQGVLWMILEIAAVGLALWLWNEGEISVGTVAMIQIFVGKLFGTFWELSGSLKNFFRSLSDAREMTAILDRPVTLRDPDRPRKLTINKGEIVFENVSFAYGHSQAAVLRDFDLHLVGGESVGLVGASGAGKSTLVKALLRLADLSGGRILIDGIDIASVRQDDLHRQIAYVPQEPLLFHRSIFENIAYAKEGATAAEVERAAREAHAHEFIVDLPAGYQTLVGERGVKLSGGQRQRVALARAFLKDAPILILDEATSALDSRSEKLIKESLDKLMSGRTVIVIAHRLATVKKLDRIIVLEKGRIVQDGTHESLLRQKGPYRDFWAHQSEETILA